MFCMKCQRDLAWCTCPDIEERLAGLSGKDGALASRWCQRCNRHWSRCHCDEPVWGIRTSGDVSVLPTEAQGAFEQLPTDRPVFPTTNQPCFDATREIRGMTKVITKSGSEYTFFSKDGKTYLKHYNPAKSSHIAAIENVAVTYSELPIEPGYPLMLTLENGQTLRSTVIVSVDLEATAKTKAP